MKVARTVLRRAAPSNECRLSDYYASGNVIKQVLKQGNHLITRAKSNCAANYAPSKRTTKPKRGRPQKYGRRVKVRDLFRSTNKVELMDSPLYGEIGVTIKVRTIDLLWEPAGQLVRFVLVEHPQASNTCR